MNQGARDSNDAMYRNQLMAKLDNIENLLTALVNRSGDGSQHIIKIGEPIAGLPDYLQPGSIKSHKQERP